MGAAVGTRAHRDESPALSVGLALLSPEAWADAPCREVWPQDGQISHQPPPGSSQGHWPGLSREAEDPLGAGQDGRGGERGQQEGAVGSPLICRKHLGKQEGWVSCSQALERGSQCFLASLTSPPSCPVSSLPKSPTPPTLCSPQSCPTCPSLSSPTPLTTASGDLPFVPLAGGKAMDTLTRVLDS